MVNDHGNFDLLAEIGTDLFLSLLRMTLEPRIMEVRPPTITISAGGFTCDVDSEFMLSAVTIDPTSPRAVITLQNNVTLILVEESGVTAIRGITNSFSVDAQISASGLDILFSSEMTPFSFFPTLVAIRDIPEIELKLAEIIAREGEAAGRAARDRLQGELTSAIRRAALNLGRPPIVLVLWAFPASLNPTVPATTTSLTVSTLNATLRLGVHLDGRTGGTGESIINNNLMRGESTLLIIRNATLLGDFVRPGVDAQLSLTGNGIFEPSSPFLWAGSVTVLPTEVGNLNLTRVEGFTESPNRIVLDLSLAARFFEGAVNARVRIRVKATLSLTPPAITGFVLTPTMLPIEVLEAWADAEPWVHVAIFFGATPLAMALAIADSIVDGELARRIPGVVSGMISLTPVAITLGIPFFLPPLRLTMLPGDMPGTHDLLATFV